jgi:bifunctional DNA-binding transcriptional regulator/antitoxin component of YhaV-PrlF toxin-antitoxin module
MENVTHTKMSNGRRVAIPAKLCHEYGLEAGSPVVLELTEHGIMLRSYQDVLRDVQAYFAKAAPKGTLLSDELISDRREEAAKETRD